MRRWPWCCRNSLSRGPHFEFLSDNSNAYVARDTRRIARALDLEPITTPVHGPQSNSLAESFVNTFQRDYLGCLDLSNASTVLAQLPAAF